MKYNQTDIVAPASVCAIGMRPMLAIFGEDEQRWEAYARLENHSDFLFGTHGTYAQAEKCMHRALRKFQSGGLLFVPTQENVYVNIYKIVRFYVDGQENACLGMVEDVSGESYIVARGTPEECAKAIMQLAKEIDDYMQWEENDGGEQTAQLAP